jgi:hypothetical protein
MRCPVLAILPAGTEHYSEQQLRELVSRHSMIGTAVPHLPESLLCLSVRLAKAPRESESSERDFYLDWLEAFEAIACQKGAIDRDASAAMNNAWADAALRTPCGKSSLPKSLRLGNRNLQHLRRPAPSQASCSCASSAFLCPVIEALDFH